MAFQVKSIASRLFNAGRYETNAAGNSNPIRNDIKNPFKSDIRMDVLTADVFGRKTEEKTSDSFISKTKRMCSTFVGSISNIGNSFSHAVESVGAFCSRIKNNTVNFWNYLNEKEIPSITDATRIIKSKWDAMNYNKSINKLAANPVSDLETMLINEIGLRTAA